MLDKNILNLSEKVFENVGHAFKYKYIHTANILRIVRDVTIFLHDKTFFRMSRLFEIAEGSKPSC